MQIRVRRKTTLSLRSIFRTYIRAGGRRIDTQLIYDLIKIGECEQKVAFEKSKLNSEYCKALWKALPLRLVSLKR